MDEIANYIASSKRYVIDVVRRSVGVESGCAVAKPPFSIRNTQFGNSGLDSAEADHWTELAQFAERRRLHAELRWEAFFAYDGLSWCDPDDVQRWSTGAVLALGRARHSDRDEPALPFFAFEVPSSAKFDRGKSRAYEHWSVDGAIDSAMERGLAQAQACREVFEHYRGSAVLGGSTNAKSLEKAFIRRRKSPQKTPGILREYLVRNHIYTEVEGARRSLVSRYSKA